MSSMRRAGNCWAERFRPRRWRRPVAWRTEIKPRASRGWRRRPSTPICFSFPPRAKSHPMTRHRRRGSRSVSGFWPVSASVPCWLGISPNRSVICGGRSTRWRRASSIRGSGRAWDGATRSPISVGISTAWPSNCKFCSVPNGACCTTFRTNYARRWRACKPPSAWHASNRRNWTLRWIASNANPVAWTNWWGNC